ncbi:MAG: DNA replication/repair protein RecF [Wenzhouxiangellaceae bacterium]
MSITRLQIEQLRNIQLADIRAGDGLNILTGDNGAGKTTVLEALAMLGRGRSFRTARSAECIQNGKNYFRTIVEFHQSGKPYHLGFERHQSSWKARLNGSDVTRVSDMARLLPSAIFEPQSQELINGGPDGRRRFIDWGLFHVEHRFLKLWREHDRILKQRNKALRESSPERVIRSLDQVLLPLATELHQLRQQHVSTLSEHWQPLIQRIAPDLSDMQLSLRRGWAKDKSLEEALNDGLVQDRIYQRTRNGAHRDDLNLTQSGIKAQTVLSRGQQKLAALGLILSQLDVWRSGIPQKPIVILDDLTSELDERHSRLILDWLMETGLQVWISAVSWPKSLDQSLQESQSVMFHVEHGNVQQML